jgi:hypothetical protein
MSDAAYKMIGICCIILSVFVLLGALFLGGAVPVLVVRLCALVGLALLGCGVFFYKILKKET